MPGMGGRKTLHELLRLDSSLRVVIANGYAANDQGEKSLYSGAKGFVGKPFRVRELAAMLRDVLDDRG